MWRGLFLKATTKRTLYRVATVQGFQWKLLDWNFQGLHFRVWNVLTTLWLAASYSRSNQKNQMSLLRGLTGNYTKNYTNSMTTIELIPERFENKRARKRWTQWNANWTSWTGRQCACVNTGVNLWTCKVLCREPQFWLRLGNLQVERAQMRNVFFLPCFRLNHT